MVRCLVAKISSLSADSPASGPLSVADARQRGLEVDTGQLQRGAFEVDHVAVVGALQRDRDHVGAEQRLERRIGVVTLRRDLDVNAVAPGGVIADECERRIAAAKFAVDGVDDAGAGAMNRMKFNPVQSLLQNPSPNLRP